MRRFVRLLIPAAPLALGPLGACSVEGTRVVSDSRDLARTEEVMDVRIESGDPATHDKETSARVGFGADGRESRLLLHFPKIRELYAPDVDAAAITQVELLLSCARVPVNPSFIRLRRVARPWTPFATWESPVGILGGIAWGAPGGDIDGRFGAITPALRRNARDTSRIELAFDVTAQVRAMVERKVENHGFLVSVERSALNADQEMSFDTTNTPVEGARPLAVLAFTTKETTLP